MSVLGDVPQVGQVATLIAVRDVHAAVMGGTVMSVGKDRIVLRVDEHERLASPALEIGRGLKLLYGAGGMVMRLKATVEELTLEAGHLVLRYDDPPRPGERREYIRAEMVLTFLATVMPAGTIDESVAALAAAEPAFDDERWRVQLVDLSGSGIKFQSPECYELGSLVGLFIRIETQPGQPLGLLGRVVRSAPRDEGAGWDVALQFERPSLADQDAVINLVFKVRYEELGG